MTPGASSDVLRFSGVAGEDTTPTYWAGVISADWQPRVPDVQVEQFEVNQRVVVAAEEAEIVEHGLTAVCPGDDMMDIAPSG